MIKNKCLRCGKKFTDNVRIVAVEHYVVNTRRGDFVSGNGDSTEYIHLSCIPEVV